MAIHLHRRWLHFHSRPYRVLRRGSDIDTRRTGSNDQSYINLIKSFRVPSDWFEGNPSADPTPTSAVISTDGQVFTVEQGGLVAVDGVTLSSGGPGTTISGIPMAWAPVESWLGRIPFAYRLSLALLLPRELRSPVPRQSRLVFRDGSSGV